MISSLLKHLTSVPAYIGNPFRDQPGFLIEGLEVFEDLNPNTRYVGETRLTFDGRNLGLFFKREGKVSAFYTFLLIIYNSYAYDSKASFSFNSKTFVSSKSSILDFKSLYYGFAAEEENCLQIKFSQTDEGSNALYVNRKTLFFIIDSEHDDDYYLNKELANWRIASRYL